MTIDKAIDENVELIGELTREGRLEKAKGVKLGNEALKRIQVQMKTWGPVAYARLPGETEE